MISLGQSWLEAGKRDNISNRPFWSKERQAMVSGEYSAVATLKDLQQMAQNWLRAGLFEVSPWAVEEMLLSPPVGGAFCNYNLNQGSLNYPFCVGSNNANVW